MDRTIDMQESSNNPYFKPLLNPILLELSDMYWKEDMDATDKMQAVDKRLDTYTPKPEPPKYGTHLINKGDTIWNISQTLGITVQELLDINGLTPDSTIYAGDGLKIPLNSGLPVLEDRKPDWGPAGRFAEYTQRISSEAPYDMSSFVPAEGHIYEMDPQKYWDQEYKTRNMASLFGKLWNEQPPGWAQLRIKGTIQEEMPRLRHLIEGRIPTGESMSQTLKDRLIQHYPKDLRAGDFPFTTPLELSQAITGASPSAYDEARRNQNKMFNLLPDPEREYMADHFGDPTDPNYWNARVHVAIIPDEMGAVELAGDDETEYGEDYTFGLKTVEYDQTADIQFTGEDSGATWKGSTPYQLSRVPEILQPTNTSAIILIQGVKEDDIINFDDVLDWRDTSIPYTLSSVIAHEMGHVQLGVAGGPGAAEVVRENAPYTAKKAETVARIKQYIMAIRRMIASEEEVEYLEMPRKSVLPLGTSWRARHLQPMDSKPVQNHWHDLMEWMKTEDPHAYNFIIDLTEAQEDYLRSIIGYNTQEKSIMAV